MRPRQVDERIVRVDRLSISPGSMDMEDSDEIRQPPAPFHDGQDLGCTGITFKHAIARQEISWTRVQLPLARSASLSANTRSADLPTGG